MRRALVMVAAVATGFGAALLALQVHSLVFALVPALAFALGLYSPSRATGFVAGFLLLVAYSGVIVLMRTGQVDYMYNLVLGGFALPLIGYVAPVARSGGRWAVFVVTGLVLVTLWCVDLSMPKTTDYYQVIIESAEALEDVELYLPAPARGGAPYGELFNYPLRVAGAGVTEDYSLDFVGTEQGDMLKVQIPALQRRAKPGPRAYAASMTFQVSYLWSRAGLRLSPKHDAVAVGSVVSQESIGPVRVRLDEVVEEFKVPLKVVTGRAAVVTVRLENRTELAMGINFANSKWDSYSENLNVSMTTGDAWVDAVVQARRTMRLIGGD